MLVVSVAAGALLGSACGGDNATAQGQRPDSAAGALPEVLATIGDEQITLADVRGRAGRDLEQLDVQYRRARDGIVQRTLESLVRERLLGAEAARRGMTLDQLVAAETGSAANPGEADVAGWYQANQARLSGRTLAELRPQIVEYLRSQGREQALAALDQRLRRERQVVIRFDPYRVDLQAEGAPSLGAADAPVTLVEFSDFQCPYCQRGQATVKQLHAEYGDRVRLAFKQLPLGMHPQARLAAEAALCAADQSKYWEAREWLFGHQGGVTSDSVKGWAKEAGLDETAFSKCLDSDAHAKDLQADMATADALATSSTPTFFVNGRLLQGALPVAQFREVIEDELSRAATKAPAAVKP